MGYRVMQYPFYAFKRSLFKLPYILSWSIHFLRISFIGNITASFDAGNQLLTGIATDVAGAANACVCVFCLQIGGLNIS